MTPHGDTERVATLLHELELAQYESLILPTVKPVAYLALASEPVGSGLSRFGGDPDLPVHLDWPHDDGAPMEFVLQLDLADVPEHVRGPLPGSGMLWWFSGVDEPASDVTTRILVDAHPQPVVRVPTPTEVKRGATEGSRAAYLEVIAAPDVPRWATDDYDAITWDVMSDDEAEEFESLGWALQPKGRVVLGRLFGHAAGIGHDPRKDAHVVRDVDPKLLYDYVARSALDIDAHVANWVHLLTLDSCRELDLMIWDAGYLQTLIHVDDLAAMRFDRVYSSVESS